MNTEHYPNRHQHSFRAMGCQMSIWLEHDDADEALDALHSAEDLLATAEARLSRFLAGSELSRLNAHAGEWFAVSRVLWQLLTRARQLAQETDGLFDPTMLHELESAGYHTSFSKLAKRNITVQPDMVCKTADLSTCVRGQWQKIDFYNAGHAVRLPQNVKVDLGGIAKGATAQAAVNFLSHWGPCLVDAGGDLTAGDAPNQLPGWPVAVAVPSNAEEGIEDNKGSATPIQIWLAHGTLATSGIDYRRWQVDGNEAHHIIDPRTRMPAATDLLTVSVLSSDGPHAEAWATAGLIAGTSTGLQTFEEKNLAAVLIDNAGNIHQTSHLGQCVAASQGKI